MPSVNMPLPASLFLPDLLKRTIVQAVCEDRLRVGLDECIDHLNSCDPFKILAVVYTDNSADRFSQTILETYCYEQNIPFMKTDLRMMKRIFRCIQMSTSVFSDEVDRENPSCMIIMVSLKL